jgi:hypothetical protein
MRRTLAGGDGYPLLGQYCTPGAASPPGAFSPNYGNLTISSDGTVYLPIGTGTSYYDSMPCNSSPDPLHPGYPHLLKNTDGSVTESSQLQVMAIQSSGAYSIRQIDSISSTQSGNFAGPGGLFFDGSLGVSFGGATPDGNGGTLLAVNTAYWASSVPNAFYHDTGSAASKLNLSFKPTGEILTGEDGTAYLAGPNASPATTSAIAAINTASNSINWTDTLSSGSPQLLAVPAAGGIVFEDASGHLNITDPNGVISPLFPGNNGSDAGPLNTTNLNYWALGTWFASFNGGFAPIAGSTATLDVSYWPMPGGGPQKQDAPLHKIPVRVYSITEDNISDQVISTVVQDGIDYWKKHGIPLEWSVDASCPSKSIVGTKNAPICLVSACPPSKSCDVNTDPDSLLNVLNTTQADLNRKLADAQARWPDRKGLNLVFIGSVYDVNTNAYTLTPSGSPSLNVTLFDANPGDVAPHEIGHEFRLPHVGIDTSNLMCGSRGFLDDVLWALYNLVGASECDPDKSRGLTDSQIKTATEAARGLVPTPK